jgi:molybdopterin molybdotransferase
MSQFLQLIPPDEARAILLSHLSDPIDSDGNWSVLRSEEIETLSSIGRVTVEDNRAPHPLPEFSRSTVDGYAVRASDTFGATDQLPAYLNLIGEIPMGMEPNFELNSDQCAVIHTGGMIPKGANAVVMLEFTQEINKKKGHGRRQSKSFSSPDPINPESEKEIEVLRPVSEGENVILVGEDVKQGMVAIPSNRRIRAQEIGGLLALGTLTLRVAKKPRVGIVSTGDEIVNPNFMPRFGQVRDINSFTLSALVATSGGDPILYGIIPDDINRLKEISSRALIECDVVIITAGSSASSRDNTAEAIHSVGEPGVLVHGINTRPGKPTILGACSGKAVIGLPGNPVSALVNGYLFVLPVIDKLLGLPYDFLTGSIQHPLMSAKLTVNLPSQSGREDWWPVKLIPISNKGDYPSKKEQGVRLMGNFYAEPIFGKSNLIFSLIAADGLLRIPPEVTGLSAGELVEVIQI